MTRTIDETTKQEWRELGFSYTQDDSKNWILHGSKAGIEKLIQLIREYAANPANDSLSEHVHYGPYMYLKIMTWNEAVIAPDYWAGTVEDLKRLAGIIEGKLRGSGQSEFEIGGEYSGVSSSKIRIVIEDDSFDPASMDR